MAEQLEHRVHVHSPGSRASTPAPAAPQQDSAAAAASRLSKALALACKAASDVQQWMGALERPVHPCALGLYRIVYGLALLAHLIHTSEALQALQESYFTLPTWHMLPPATPGMSVLLLAIAFLAGLCLTLGLATRASSVVMLAVTAYLSSMVQERDSRAASVLLQLGVLNCFMQLGRWASADMLLACRKPARRATTHVPFWNLVLLRMLLLKPHFQDAMAKANGDWLLRAQPLHLWLRARHGLLGKGFLPWLVSSTTFAMDLAVPYLLLNPKMRYALGFPAVLVTQAMNHQAFGLDGGAFLTAATLLAFLPPEAIARSLRGRRGDVESPATAAVADASGSSAAGSPQPAPRVRGFSWGWANCRIGVFATPTLHTPPVSPSPAQSSANGGDGDEETSSKGRGRGHHQRRLLYVFVCAFVVVNVLLPLHHWMLYPSKPSWTEEGHFAAWHPRLRAKEGWLYLVAQEAGTEQVLDLVPDTDSLLLTIQVQALESPAALLRYCWRLRQLFDVAGRPLGSIRAMSCYSLNGHTHKALHDATVDLLHYSPAWYRWPGQTAVSKWVHDFDTAPTCDPYAPPQWRYGMVRRSRDALEALQGAAGLRRSVSHDGGDSPHQAVCKMSKGGKCIQLAYMWNATWPLGE